MKVIHFSGTNFINTFKLSTDEAHQLNTMKAEITPNHQNANYIWAGIAIVDTAEEGFSPKDAEFKRFAKSIESKAPLGNVYIHRNEINLDSAEQRKYVDLLNLKENQKENKG